MFRQHGHLPGDLRQLAVALHGEDEAHLPLARLFHAFDIAVIEGIEGVRLLEVLHGPDHILRRDRLPVMKAGLLAQPVGDEGAILRIGHGLGDQTVFRGRLIQRRFDQPVENGADSAGRLTLEGEGIEGIEGAKGIQPHAPALGGIRFDIVEVLEIRSILEIAEQ